MRIVTDEGTRELAGVVAAVIFAVAGGIELVRLVVLRETWPGISAGADWALTSIAVVLWAVSAYLMVRRRERWSFVPLLGTFVLFAHGILGAVVDSKIAPAFVALAVLLPLVQRLAFGGRLELGTPAPPPRRSNVGHEVI